MTTNPALLPQPRSVTLTGQAWKTGCRSEVLISADHGLQNEAALLVDYLSRENHITASVAVGGVDGDIHLAQRLPPQTLTSALSSAGFSDETHHITIAPEQVLLNGASRAAVARGIQSLRQLMSGQCAGIEIPGMVVEDSPEFGWRGLHLDVARHFRDAADVRRFIDLAAYHKFNLFHWYLTDDQGWRLPVDGYPRLIEIAAWRDGTLIGEDGPCRSETDGVRHGGFYSHEEIREIVAYAAARGVHVLPAANVPGHVQALVTAYPEFGNTGNAPGVRTQWGVSDTSLNLERATFEFLEKLVATIVELFPFPFIHLGGDEVETGEWASSPAIQVRKQELGINSDPGVQHYFTKRLAEMASRHGRRMIGWDEIVEAGPLPDGTAVMFWRDDAERIKAGLDRIALRAGAPVVLANAKMTYLNFYQNAEMESEPLAYPEVLSIEKIYEWRPLERYEPSLRAGVLGAQAQVWTEYIPTRELLDYMVYPRACAVAQVMWTGEHRESWVEFSRRLDTHLKRLDRAGVGYKPFGVPARKSESTGSRTSQYALQ